MKIALTPNVVCNYLALPLSASVSFYRSIEILKKSADLFYAKKYAKAFSYLRVGMMEFLYGIATIFVFSSFLFLSLAANILLRVCTSLIGSIMELSKGIQTAIAEKKASDKAEKPDVYIENRVKKFLKGRVDNKPDDESAEYVINQAYAYYLAFVLKKKHVTQKENINRFILFLQKQQDEGVISLTVNKVPADLTYIKNTLEKSSFLPHLGLLQQRKQEIKANNNTIKSLAHCMSAFGCGVSAVGLFFCPPLLPVGITLFSLGIAMNVFHNAYLSVLPAIQQILYRVFLAPEAQYKYEYYQGIYNEMCKDPAIAPSRDQEQTLNSIKDIAIHKEAPNAGINEQDPDNIISLDTDKKDFNQQFENSFSKKEIINLRRNYESKQFRTFVKEKIYTFFGYHKDCVKNSPKDDIVDNSVGSYTASQ